MAYCLVFHLILSFSQIFAEGSFLAKHGHNATLVTVVETSIAFISRELMIIWEKRDRVGRGVLVRRKAMAYTRGSLWEPDFIWSVSRNVYLRNSIWQ